MKGKVERVPLLDVIIVNWHSGDFLNKCVKSIVRASKSGFILNCVWIVDNDSKDFSEDALKKCGLSFCFIYNKENKGYAVAANQAAFLSKANYILFLNPDVELSKNSLSVPIAVMEENRDIGIAGIKLTNENGDIWRSTARFPTPHSFCIRSLGLDKIFPKVFKSYFMTEWDHQDTRFVDHVIGAFFLVRKELFDTLMGFDERFFVYFEDLDFSLRAAKLKWKSIYIAEASAFHKGGGTTENVKDVRLFYSLRSRILYAEKHFNKVPLNFVLFCTLVVEFVSRVVYCSLSKSFSDIKATLNAYYMLWKYFFQKKENRRIGE